MNLLKEPLLHFLLLGATLFLLDGWRGDNTSIPVGQTGTSTTQIFVTEENIAQMSDLFTKTWQRLPTEEEQKGLLEDFVRSEIYYREAIAIGLDRDDEVLKRRLRQKMEFIYEDITSLAEPTDEDLKAFMENHREKYLEDPQITFQQVYVDTARRGTGAEVDARQILTQLIAGGDAASFGDTSLLEPEVQLSPLRDINKQFGDEFGRNLLELKSGEWFGPIRYKFGLHLVFIKELLAPRLPDLTEVREIMKRDYLAERQKALKDAAYAKIRERYHVVVKRSKTVAASGATETNNKSTTQ